MNKFLQEDRRLLSRCFSGDSEAADRLVRQFSNLVYKTVHHTFLVNQAAFTREDVEDLHNTVFLRLFDNRCKKLKQYQGKNGCSLASWIRLVTVRTVLNELRRKGVDSVGSHRRRKPLEEVPEIRENQDGPRAQMVRAEQERLLKDSFEKLPPRYRLFIELHFVRELPLAEVAAAMQLTMDNVYTIKHRAIRKLKAQIARAEK
jgi:RNA polymerase sigma-70 factor (ECF subfamily)